MADATIVIVENCTAELARRGKVSAAERMETIIHATATMTRPLLFSMLIIVTSFLPIFFLGARGGPPLQPAGVQQDVRDGVLESADAVPAAGDHRLGIQAQRRPC